MPVTYFEDEIEKGEQGSRTEKKQDDMDPLKIIDEVKKNYAEMHSYSSDVHIVYDLVRGKEPDKRIIKGNLKLLKPDLYNISWEEDSSSGHSGAAWNSGRGPFSLIGKDHYLTTKTNTLNLAAMTGVSSRITYTLPFLFFKEDNNVFADLKSFRMVNSETINNDDCFVIEASNADIPKILFWISKNRKVILQIEEHEQANTSNKAEANSTELSDEEIKVLLTANDGKEPTPEIIKKTKELMSKAAVEREGTIKEIFENIQINSNIETQSLSVPIPEGVVVQELN